MTTSQHGRPGSGPSDAELEAMTPDELAHLASELDDVDVVHNQRKWPIPGTRAEKRAERAVALWFLISALSGLAFIVAFLFWPYHYAGPQDPVAHATYLAYTPARAAQMALPVAFADPVRD